MKLVFLLIALGVSSAALRAESTAHRFPPTRPGAAANQLRASLAPAAKPAAKAPAGQHPRKKKPRKKIRRAP